MSIRGDGVLFADVWLGPCTFEEFKRFNIDPNNGQGNIIGMLIDYIAFDTCVAGNGLAFSPNDTLYYSSTRCAEPDATIGQIYTVNQVTGQASLMSTVNFPFDPGDTVRTNAITFHPGGGMYASIISSNDGNFLGVINPVTGGVSILGQTVGCLDAIAFSPPANVPTLSEWGLIAMAGILGIIGFIMAIRRRKVTA
jgi:hypothetical protein